MKRWFVRVGFVAPAIAIVALGTATTAFGARSAGGQTAVVSIAQPSASETSSTMTDPPPAVVTPISVPPGIAHDESNGRPDAQTLAQTITLVILPANSGEG